MKSTLKISRRFASTLFASLLMAMLAAPSQQVFARNDSDAANGGSLSKAEREFLIQYMQQTKKKLLDEISGLSEAQMKFKPTPFTWSILEVAEHLALSEDVLYSLVTERVMKSPAQPQLKGENGPRIKDRAIVMFLTNRAAQRLRAPDPVRPARTVKLAAKGDILDRFEKSRARNIAYIETTKDDLRSHFSANAIGMIDAYQWLVVLAAHTERHTEQILEVKSHPNFPAK